MRRRHLQRVVLIGGALFFGTVTHAHSQLARELGLLPSDTALGIARVAVLPTESNFALDQLRNERVLEARVSARFNIKRLFHERGLRYPAAEAYLRIFKRERSLELWVRPTGEHKFSLLKTYAICALAGELGPKTRQGDSQVPEGFYFVDFFNPRSDYYLSLHLDYPNQRDRLNNATATDLGGDIFIHGGCNSEGCLAVTDEGIKELYWMAVEARAVGQQRIPVHIFPARLGAVELQALQTAFSTRPDLAYFWSTLKPAFDFFEETRTLPAVAVDAGGTYRINGAGADVLGTPATLGQPAATGSTPGTPAARAPAPGAPLGTPNGPVQTQQQKPKPKGPIGTPVGGGSGG